MPVHDQQEYLIQGEVNGTHTPNTETRRLGRSILIPRACLPGWDDDEDDAKAECSFDDEAQQTNRINDTETQVFRTQIMGPLSQQCQRELQEHYRIQVR